MVFAEISKNRSPVISSGGTFLPQTVLHLHSNPREPVEAIDASQATKPCASTTGEWAKRD
jgi:hypothetical protein